MYFLGFALKRPHPPRTFHCVPGVFLYSFVVCPLIALDFNFDFSLFCKNLLVFISTHAGENARLRELDFSVMRV